MDEMDEEVKANLSQVKGRPHTSDPILHFRKLIEMNERISEKEKSVKSKKSHSKHDHYLFYTNRAG